MSENNSNKEEKQQVSVNPEESAQRLEAIKNLIFGENIQQIDNDFNELKLHIEKRKEELEDLLDDTQKKLSNVIDNLATDLNIRISDLEAKFDEDISSLNHKKMDRNLLGTLLVSMGEKIMKG